MTKSKEEIARGIEAREARLRKQFPAVWGKVVDWIDL